MRKWWLLVLLAAACGRSELAQKNQENATATAPTTETRVVVPVEATTPRRGAISEYFVTTSRIEAEQRVSVTPKGMGKCIALLVEEGATVSPGDILAELDKRDIEAGIRQQQVQVRQAEVDLARTRQAFEYGISAKMELDNAEFRLETAKATMESQQLQLEEQTIQAPIQGIVTKRNIQLGQLVSTGTVAFEIVDPASYLFHIFVPEKELGRLSPGQTAKVAIDALPEGEFDAQVTYISPDVDRKAGTVKVRLEVASEIKAKLREAAFARVRLVMETRENALLVPKDAVIELNARTYVFVVKEATEADLRPGAAAQAESTGAAAPPPTTTARQPDFTQVARRVEIQLGLRDSADAEILTGASDEDMIVTMGQKNLKPDTPVRLASTAGELAKLDDVTTEQALTEAKAKRGELEEIAKTKREEARDLRDAKEQVDTEEGATSK